MRRLTTEDFIAKAKSAHGGRYDYSLSVYVGGMGKVTIICPEHGEFEQIARNHTGKQRSGCPMCSGRGVDWVERFRSVHGDLWDYSLVDYRGYQEKVKIGCKVHGVFEQTPDNHYRGEQGCPKCKGARIRSSKQMSIQEFVRRASLVHGGKYTYGTAQFTNVLTGVADICCPEHGWFQQSPVNHLAGKVGCARCNYVTSRTEESVASLLTLFTAVQRRDRQIIGPLELDIVLPEKQLAIEFCGEYWHSAGDQESEAKMSTKHISKHKQAADAGYRLITIFESEWQNHNYAIRRLLRNAVGAGRGKVMARKCELQKVEHKAAVAFYDRYHPQGGGGYGEHYGLFWKGKLVACMRFTEGINDRGLNKHRTWTLSRYATRVTVTGGASRLFKAFVTEQNPRTVKSFSDNRFFAGGMYEQLGFEMKEESAADYMVWHPKLGLTPKSHWQRREITARAKQLGIEIEFDHETDPRTERDMTYLLGGRRIHDCGKKTWVWPRPLTPPKKPDTLATP